MATATEPEHADAAGYVDFDEFIDYQITKTRSGIKATDLLTALIGASAAVLAYVLVFAVFDHWVIDGGFRSGTRYGLLSLLVVGLIGWTLWKLVLPYFRKVTTLYAAKQIEEAQPDLQNTLLTLVDLKRSGRRVPESIEAALEKRSALSLSHTDVEQAVDRRLLMRLSYVLLALVVLMCAYVLFSPKKLSNSLWRALLPASNVSVATRTRIDNVDPGDVEVLARSQLQVTADLSGEVPDAVTLLFTTADRRFVDEPVAMRETDEGLRRFGGVITGENGAGILQSLTYRVVAGDAHSDSYAVSVKQPPSATVQEVQYEYPDYMGLANRTQAGGSVDAWEGTWVNIRATANMPLKSAMVMFSDTEDISQKAEEIPANVENGTEITARWRLRIRGDGTYAGFYRVQCRNERGETDTDPTLYSIKIRPDQPPRIELAQPTGDIERPANAIVPLLYAAEDPDFLLRSVILHLELNGDVLPQQPRLYQAPPFRQALHDVYNLELESLELKAGDRLTYWLEARDNMEPFADRSGNRANTPKLNITITEPASPEEVQEQLEDDQQQIADKLDEARQPPSDEPSRPQEGSQEMDDNTSPPPANPDQPTDQGGEPPPDQGSDGQQQQQGGESGESQPSPGDGQGQSGRGQQSGASEGGESGGDQTSPNGGSGTDPNSEESFDNVLERLMQREQEREQSQNGSDQSPEDQTGQRQPGAEPQPGETGEPPPNGQQDGQSGQSGESTGAKGADGSTGQPTPQPGTPGESTSPSPGQGSSPTESMTDTPSPGEGTSPSSASDINDSQHAKPQAGQGGEGQPQPGDGTQPPSGDSPTNDTPSQGGPKQPGDDSTGAQPGSGDPTEGVQPKPGAGPESMSDQPGPKPGDPLQNPDAKTGGQPDGPDEPLKGEGDPQGQRSDQPQTGEGGNSQQTSQGNRGGDQQGSGDSTGQPGAQESSGEQTGQPGAKPGEGSRQQPGGAKPGSKGNPSQGTPSDSQTEGQPSTGGGDPPEMSDTPSDAESGPNGQSGGEGQPPGGGEQPQQGQPSGDQGGEGQSGQSQGGEGQSGQSGETPGQGGQPGEGQSPTGGQPGTPPTDGTPSGPGGGTHSDGGRQLDGTSPKGQGGGGEGEPDEGAAAAGEGGDPSLQPEAADLAAKKKAANLVLDRLQEQLQRGEIDPELQEELNLTPEQLRNFTQKLEQRLSELDAEDTSPEAEARRRQFEETLRTIDYASKGTTREGGDGPRESASGFAGPNRPAPPQHRDAARRYRERLLKNQRGR